MHLQIFDKRKIDGWSLFKILALQMKLLMHGLAEIHPKMLKIENFVLLVYGTCSCVCIAMQ